MHLEMNGERHHVAIFKFELTQKLIFFFPTFSPSQLTSCSLAPYLASISKKVTQKTLIESLIDLNVNSIFCQKEDFTGNIPVLKTEPYNHPFIFSSNSHHNALHIMTFYATLFLETSLHLDF